MCHSQRRRRKSNAYFNTYSHGNIHAYTDSYSYSDLHSYSNCDGHFYADTYGYGNVHSDADTNANLYPVLHLHQLHRRYDRSRNYRHRQSRRRRWHGDFTSFPSGVVRNPVHAGHRGIQRPPELWDSLQRL